MDPVFRPIPRAPLYAISEAGVIRGIHVPYLKPIYNADGYRVVSLQGRQYLISCLVLETFVGPRPPGMQARHLNGDKGDNRLSNLEWSTPTTNARDRSSHGTQVHGERQWAAKLTRSKAIEIVELVRGGATLKGVALRYSVPQSTVWKIMHGYAWQRATGIRPHAGGKPGRAKLTPAQVDEMWILHKAGKSQTAIAAMLGVTQSAIGYRIRNP